MAVPKLQALRGAPLPPFWGAAGQAGRVVLSHSGRICHCPVRIAELCPVVPHRTNVQRLSLVPEKMTRNNNSWLQQFVAFAQEVRLGEIGKSFF